MNERMVGLRILACGREASMREGLRRRFVIAGALVDEATDPAAALSLAAAAAASGRPYRLTAVDGTSLQPDDLGLYLRVGELFGEPKIPVLQIGGVRPSGDVAFAVDAADGEAFGRALGGSVPAQGAAAPAGQAPAAPVAPSVDGPIRVLLAEDNEVNQLVAVGMLTSLGYVSEVVPNGAEAVTAMERGGFDIVLMDVRMPVMDGLEATRRIRKLPPPAGGVPIVAVTANAMRGDEDACLNAGMNDYLAKPIRLAMLDAAIKRQLTQK